MVALRLSIKIHLRRYFCEKDTTVILDMVICFAKMLLFGRHKA